MELMYLKIYSREQILEKTSIRTGEIKTGEKVHAIMDAANWEEELKISKARYVLLGIPEDIGVRANYGKEGARTAWDASLKSVLNTQHNGERGIAAQLLVLGHLDFRSLEPVPATTETLRNAVVKIDQAVTALISKITAAGKVPLVIGGGHNNAYPIIKGVALGLEKSGRTSQAFINTINIDAHTDFRRKEGRHSGNGFRYAYEEGFLKKYAILALQECYAQEAVMKELAENEDIRFWSWEHIFLQHKTDWREAVNEAIQHVRNHPSGLEIDLDSISHVLSSATTPCGITAREARQTVYEISGKTAPVYFHICEGAVQLDNSLHDPGTSKLIAYLVGDFILAQEQ